MRPCFDDNLNGKIVKQWLLCPLIVILLCFDVNVIYINKFMSVGGVYNLHKRYKLYQIIIMLILECMSDDAWKTTLPRYYPKYHSTKRTSHKTGNLQTKKENRVPTFPGIALCSIVISHFI